jgi:hypothetical protein
LAVIVSLAGLAVAAIGLLGVAAPAMLIDLLARWRVLTRLPVTLGLRVGFGILFLVAASHCRLPDLLRVVGILELVGAAVLLVAGSERLQSFVAWWLQRPPAFVRYWCSGAFAFGILLTYAGAQP